MTLEMGKPVAESKSEIVYAADFFRWHSGEALRLDGYYKQFGNGTSRVLTMKQPVGPCLMITPWNFPMAMGTRKVGPAIAAGLHDRDEAGAADAALHARPRPDPRGGRPPRRRVQHRHHLVVGQGHRAADRGHAPAQAVLHRLHRGGQEADRGVRRERPQDVDGARRQRPLPRVRGRRSRRRGGGSAARQDAQHRRGLHLRQPLPRGRLREGRVRAPAGRAHGRAQDRPRHRGGREGGPADRRALAREGGRAGGGRGREGRHAPHRRRGP